MSVTWQWHSDRIQPTLYLSASQLTKDSQDSWVIHWAHSPLCWVYNLFFFFFFYLAPLQGLSKSPTRNQTYVPAVEVWSLNRWSTMEVPLHLLMTLIFHWETLGLYSQSNWFEWDWPLSIPHMPTHVTWAWPTAEFQAFGHNANPVQWDSTWNLVLL